MRKIGRDRRREDDERPSSDTERTPLVGYSSGTPRRQNGRQEQQQRRRRDLPPSSSVPDPPPPSSRRRAGSLGEVFVLDDDRKVFPAGSCRSIFQLGGDDASCAFGYPAAGGAGGRQQRQQQKSKSPPRNAGDYGGTDDADGAQIPKSGTGHRRGASDWSVGISNATIPHRNVVVAPTRGQDMNFAEETIKEEKPLSRRSGWGDRSKQGESGETTLYDSGRTSGGSGSGRKSERPRRRGLVPKHYAFLAKVVLTLLYALLAAYTLMVCAGPLILLPIDKSEWCPESVIDGAEAAIMGGGSRDNGAPGADDDSTNDEDEDLYENPDYITDPCRYARVPQLLMLTLEECDLSRRMLASVLFGGAIGYERRSSDRPAGIRTMGLVSLGSCFFTISSMLAFKSSTMGWDSSRVTAAIPSGVGFLGAGLIWKGTIGSGEEEMHQVHGLTTAASVWLSAAVGVGAGGALYFVSAYSVVLVTLILRYGPKLYLQDDSSYHDEDDDGDDDTDVDSSGYSTDEDLSDHPNHEGKDVEDENRESVGRDERGADGDESLESFSQGFLSPQYTRGKAMMAEGALTTRAGNLWASEKDGLGGEGASRSEKDAASAGTGEEKHVHGPLFAMQSDLTGPSMSSFAVGYDFLTSSMRSIPGGSSRRSLPRQQQQQQHVQFDSDASQQQHEQTEPAAAPSTPKRTASVADAKAIGRDGSKKQSEKGAEKKKRKHKKSSVPSFHS